MAQLGKWLPILISYKCKDPDYSDGDEIMGWLGATLVGDVLTVNYESDPDEDRPSVTERYRIVPID